MKKLLVACLAVIILLSLCACQSKELAELDGKLLMLIEAEFEDDALSEEVEAELAALSDKEKEKLKNYGSYTDAKFEHEYKHLFLCLSFYSLKCDDLSSMVYTIWDIVGPEYLMKTLAYMYSVPEDYDEYLDSRGEEDYLRMIIERYFADEYGWSYISFSGISRYSGELEKFHNICVNFKKLYGDFEGMESDIVEMIRSFKAAYSETHGESFELLNDLYIEVSSYADLAKNPTGNLASYGSSIDKYKNEISRLSKAADIFYLF